MIYAQLPDATDPFTPHQVMLDVAYVGGVVFLDVVDCAEDSTTTTRVKREQASISVDASALLWILEGMIRGDTHDKVRRESGHMDKNFYSGYMSPLGKDKPKTRKSDALEEP